MQSQPESQAVSEESGMTAGKNRRDTRTYRDSLHSVGLLRVCVLIDFSKISYLPGGGRGRGQVRADALTSPGDQEKGVRVRAERRKRRGAKRKPDCQNI